MDNNSAQLRCLLNDLRVRLNDNRYSRSSLVDLCSEYLKGKTKLFLWGRNHYTQRGNNDGEMELLIMEALLKKPNDDTNINTTTITHLLVDSYRTTQWHEQIAQVMMQTNNRSIVKLHLMDNDLGNDGCIAVVNALKSNNNITCLCLSSNKIKNEGAQAIAEFLKTNKTLTKLALFCNEIGDEGCVAIASALEEKANTSLQCLDLQSNEIGNEGALKLADTLTRNETMTQLNFNFNERIGVEGREALIGVLREHNATLTEFNVLGCGMNDDQMKRMKFYLSLNLAGRNIMMSKCINNSAKTTENQVQTFIRTRHDINIAMSFLLLAPELCNHGGQDNPGCDDNECQWHGKRKRD